MIAISISSHAGQRWNDHGMRGSPAREVRWRLQESLRRGASPDTKGAVHVYIRDEVWAVCMPEFWGGWSVVTFYIPGVKLESA